jgi:hypothetical protein
MQLQDRQPNRARIWGTVGMAGLFVVVAIGVYVGTHIRTSARATVASSSPVAASGRIGPPPSMAGSPDTSPSSTAATAIRSATSGPAAGGSGGSGGSAGGGPAPAVPDAPGNLALAIVEHYATDLTVSVTWTAPKANGAPITGYLVLTHSAPDFQDARTVRSTMAVVMVPCSSSCHARYVDVEVQAVTDVGDGPLALVTYRGGLAAGDVECVLTTFPQPIGTQLGCFLADTNDTGVTWTVNGAVQSAFQDNPNSGFDCNSMGPRLHLEVAIRSSAGTTYRTFDFQCP